MSTTRMMVLGLVQQRQPVHGYDVRRELLSWRADEWARLHPGSIYHALKKLTGEGLLREVATEQVGSRPARTTYEITPAGSHELAVLLRRYWWQYEEPDDAFLAAFAFLPMLPRDEVVAALRHRAAVLRGHAEQCRAGLAGWVAAKPAHVGWQLERRVALAEAEAAWCDRTADRMAADRMAAEASIGF